jgi:hypothetical protein
MSIRNFVIPSASERSSLATIAFGTIALLLTFASSSQGQASATASRLAEAQVGGGYTVAHSDYARSYFNGYSVYGDLDFRDHLGVEATFHHIGDGDGYTGETENSYEVGARYSRHFRRFQPYGKFMFGRGVFNYKLYDLHGDYNLYAYGGGVDIRVLPSINVRAEFEQQNWFNFPPNGLTPDFATVGVAYHFK